MRASILAVLATTVCACAQRPAPQEPSQRALYRDLERIITVNATTGWGIDKIELEKLLAPALDSACRVDALDRRALLDWLAAEDRRMGGPVEKAWRERGKDLDEVDDLLMLTRVAKLLERAEELSLDCPFWFEVEHPFRGRQLLESSWMLSFSGGGKGTLVFQGGDTDFSAGGAGRALFGRTFGRGHALLAGIESGASASFPKDADGNRSSLELGLDLVAPLVYRRTFTNTYFELESGWLGRTTERDWGALDQGIHVGAAIGARALRTRFVFPGAAFGVSWERTFLDGADVTTIKLGARVVFDFDL